MSALERLVVVLGPTASGKSALGIRLAERLNGEILVCDSTQVYRHFDIGTAKVAQRDQGGIAHHLLDLVEPDEVFTAGEYRRQALNALGGLRRRGKLPVITAGTGLYLRALLEGLADAPTRSEELRGRLRYSEEVRGPAHLHKILTRLDSESAARIAPRDTQKIIRAIEMRLLAGKPVAEIFRAGRSSLEGYAVTKIGLLPPRPALYARIDARVEAMIEAGWLEEVRGLIARGVPAGAKPFQFIGYAELRAHLEARPAQPKGQPAQPDDRISLEEAVQQIQQSTRRFAKRQLTWFRRERDVHWLPGFGDDPEIAAAAHQLLVAPNSY